MNRNQLKFLLLTLSGIFIAGGAAAQSGWRVVDQDRAVNIDTIKRNGDLVVYQIRVLGNWGYTRYVRGDCQNFKRLEVLNDDDWSKSDFYSAYRNTSSGIELDFACSIEKSIVSQDIEQGKTQLIETSPISTQIGKRVALVIGNSNYRTRPLRNPTNDANDVSNALKSSGFQVIDLRDASLQQMRAGVRQFGDRLLNNDVGLVYYSGHGVEVKGRNYFIPVNADIQREDDQEPWLEGVIRQEFALAAPSINSLPNETVKIPEIAMNNSPSPVGVNSPQLVSLSDDEVRARIRAIKASDSVDLSTSVICDESGCFDYSKWSALLSEPSRLESLKGSLQSLIQKKDGQFCEFNADRFDCENDDHIKMTVIYPLAPFHPRKAIGGFTWIEPKITRSGGVSFKLSPITSGGLPGTCLDTEGGMQFALNRIEFPVSRMTCFNLIVPGSVKQDFQILMMDLKRKEMLVYWDWSVISFMAYGSGRHLVKVKF